MNVSIKQARSFYIKEKNLASIAAFEQQFIIHWLKQGKLIYLGAAFMAWFSTHANVEIIRSLLISPPSRKLRSLYHRLKDLLTKWNIYCQSTEEGNNWARERLSINWVRFLEFEGHPLGWLGLITGPLVEDPVDFYGESLATQAIGFSGLWLNKIPRLIFKIQDLPLCLF